MDRISDIASAQYGLITTVQLHALGISDGGVHRRIAAGHLHRLHVGVYAVGHTAITDPGRRLAAVLAGGEHAVAGRWTAGRHLGFVKKPEPKDILEVAVRSVQPRRPGVRFLRLESLRPEDVWIVNGVPCTSAARTLFDLASVLTLPDLERACERAEYQDQLDTPAIMAIADRIDRPRGVRNLRRALGAQRLDAAAAGSELERRFLRLVLDAGLPRPELQRSFVVAPSRQIRVDCFWPDQQLVVEVDGPHHARPLARKRDAERDAGLRALGLRVHRVSLDALDHHPAIVAITVRQLLECATTSA